MTNLLQETIETLARNGRTPEHVEWVGTVETLEHPYLLRPDGDDEYEPIPPMAGTWEDFATLADVDYDSGFGGQEVNEKLLIVGRDFWLERHEYDGSEWWEYKTTPEKPATPFPLDFLVRAFRYEKN